MAEVIIPKSPIELYEGSKDEIIRLVAAHKSAEDGEAEVAERHRQVLLAQKRELDAAHQVLVAATRDFNEVGVPLLESIHNAVTDDTDPGEYLQAVINTINFGEPVGDEAVRRLAPLREALQASSIPVAVIGSTPPSTRIALGLSAGDINVTREEASDRGFEAAGGIRLSIPLEESTAYSNKFMQAGWRYFGHLDGPRPAWVGQRLSDLRLASSAAEVQELSAMEQEKWRSQAAYLEARRILQSEVGFPEVIIYGEVAVTGLLAALHRQRFIPYIREKGMSETDIFAAGLTVGIPPEAYAKVNEEEVKQQLGQAFLSTLQGATSRAIRNRKENDKHADQPSAGWPITAAPQVMRFSGVEVHEVTTAITQGLEQSFRDMRLDDPYYVDFSVDNRPDTRPTEDEARLIATQLAAGRYGLRIATKDLASKTLTDKFADQLAFHKRVADIMAK